jgi:hypothetical protein
VYEKHLDEFYYDSLTLSRFDETSKFINSRASSFRLKNYLNLRIKSYKRSIENAADLFIYKFNTENHDFDFKSINEKRNITIQQFKKNCDSSEREVTNNYLGIIKGVNLLFAISLVDSSSNYKTTKNEYYKLNDLLFFSPINVDYGKDLNSLFPKKKANILFYLSERLLEKNSSGLVVILGMLGMSFIGAVVSLLRRNLESSFRIEIITDKLFYIVIISIASSLITYLSLQGGITLITLGSDAKLNPYLILFVCFASSVYSEELWLKVKSWFAKPAENSGKV